MILYHDSLCKHINNTIMAREKVDVEKVWAPTLTETMQQLDRMELLTLIGMPRSIGGAGA